VTGAEGGEEPELPGTAVLQRRSAINTAPIGDAAGMQAGRLLEIDEL